MTATIRYHITPQAVMAYAAGLTEQAPCYFDTASPQGILAHPMFTVAAEWAVMSTIGMGSLPGIEPLTDADLATGVHLDHRVAYAAPVPTSGPIDIEITSPGLEAHRAGVLHRARLEARDARGGILWTTDQSVLFRGVSTEGLPEAPRPERSPQPAEPRDVRHIEIPRWAPHSYSACSGIWNPIHTDEAVARAAGLPGTILHGTATLALAVGEIISAHAHGRPDRVRAVGGRFQGFVTVPGHIEVRSHATTDAAGLHVGFEVTQDDRIVVSDGVVSLG